jgi:hypothetical protein
MPARAHARCNNHAKSTHTRARAHARCNNHANLPLPARTRRRVGACGRGRVQARGRGTVTPRTVTVGTVTVGGVPPWG